MPKHLTAVERLRVARACGYGYEQLEIGHFQPSKLLAQKDALVQKVAQLIEERKKKYIAASLAPNPNFGKMHANVWRTYLERLGEALATNDVNAIEQLCYELLGDKDG